MERAETKVVGTAPLAQRDIFGDNIYNVVPFGQFGQK